MKTNSMTIDVIVDVLLIPIMMLIRFEEFEWMLGSFAKSLLFFIVFVRNEFEFCNETVYKWWWSLNDRLQNQCCSTASSISDLMYSVNCNSHKVSVFYAHQINHRWSNIVKTVIESDTLTSLVLLTLTPTNGSVMTHATEMNKGVFWCDWFQQGRIHFATIIPVI